MFRTALFALLIVAAPARAQDCPGARHNDDCDRILFERADADLARAVDQRLTAITRGWGSSSPRIEDAKALFSLAHQQWLRFRQAECTAYAAAQSLISARTPAGLDFACQHTLTRKRIEEIKGY